MEVVDISIIIPTFNSMPNILYVLKSIEKQKGVSYEVIIVDRFSRDGTAKAAKEFGAKVYYLDSERTKAVNYGAKRASGRYIYYLGSDYVLLGSKHLYNIVMQMDMENADAGIVTNIVDYRKSFWASVRFIEKMAYYMDPSIEAARVFKRDLFLKIGGYREDMVVYEEHELHYRLLRLGCKIIRIKGAIEVHIDEPRSLRDIVKRFYYYGGTSVTTFISSGGSYAKKIINPVRPAFLYRLPWLMKINPIASTAGLFLYQFSRYIAGLAGLVGRKFI